MPDHRRPQITAGQRRAQSSGTPHVRIKTPGHIVELRRVADVPGAIVQLDLTVSMFSRDHPDAVQMAHVWVPLDMLVVLPPATS